MVWSMENHESKDHNTGKKPVNQMRGDGFAAVTIAVIAAVLIFVIINHFVS